MALRIVARRGGEGRWGRLESASQGEQTVRSRLRFGSGRSAMSTLSSLERRRKLCDYYYYPRYRYYADRYYYDRLLDHYYDYHPYYPLYRYCDYWDYRPLHSCEYCDPLHWRNRYKKALYWFVPCAGRRPIPPRGPPPRGTPPRGTPPRGKTSLADGPPRKASIVSVSTLVDSPPALEYNKKRPGFLKAICNWYQSQRNQEVWLL